MKDKIIYVKKIKYGYIGMNKDAAKAHGIPYHHPENVIEIKKGLSKTVRKHTEEHEEFERHAMHEWHERYHTGHNKALKSEAVINRFPQKNTNRKLKALGFKK